MDYNKALIGNILMLPISASRIQLTDNLKRNQTL